MNIQCKQVLSKEDYRSRIKELERLKREQQQEEHQAAEEQQQDAVNEPENDSDIELVKCPICWKISLAWIEANDRFECMNVKCKNRFSKEDYESRTEEWNRLLAEEPKGKAWFGNSYFDPKKKKWKKGK